MLLVQVDILMIALLMDIGNGKEAVGGHILLNLHLLKVHLVEQLLLELD